MEGYDALVSVWAERVMHHRDEKTLRKFLTSVAYDDLKALVNPGTASFDTSSTELNTQQEHDRGNYQKEESKMPSPVSQSEPHVAISAVRQLFMDGKELQDKYAGLWEEPDTDKHNSLLATKIIISKFQTELRLMSMVMGVEKMARDEKKKLEKEIVSILEGVSYLMEGQSFSCYLENLAVQYSPSLSSTFIRFFERFEIEPSNESLGEISALLQARADRYAKSEDMAQRYIIKHERLSTSSSSPSSSLSPSSSSLSSSTSHLTGRLSMSGEKSNKLSGSDNGLDTKGSELLKLTTQRRSSFNSSQLLGVKTVTMKHVRKYKVRVPRKSVGVVKDKK